jgi:hypothetical protein
MSESLPLYDSLSPTPTLYFVGEIFRATRNKPWFE